MVDPLALDLEVGKFPIALVAEEKHLSAISDQNAAIVRNPHSFLLAILPGQRGTGADVAGPGVADPPPEGV
jgi:hypothetical protein